MGVSWQRRPPSSVREVSLSHRAGMRGGTLPDDVSGDGDCLAVFHDRRAFAVIGSCRPDGHPHAAGR